MSCLVRPHLEYGNGAWSLVFRKDAILLESIQCWTTKMIPPLKDSSYPNWTYQAYTTRNLLEIWYKQIKSCKDNTKWGQIILNWRLQTPELANTNSRKKDKLESARWNFYNGLITNSLNNLPNLVVETPIINAFKERLVKYLNSRSISILQNQCTSNLEFDKGS